MLYVAVRANGAANPAAFEAEVARRLDVTNVRYRGTGVMDHDRVDTFFELDEPLFNVSAAAANGIVRYVDVLAERPDAAYTADVRRRFAEHGRDASHHVSSQNSIR